MTGRFVWYEFLTTDTAAAIAFYTDVIGWKTQPFDERTGPEAYTMWVGSQGPLGGVMTLPADALAAGAKPHWMAHVEVSDIDATTAKVAATGGAVHIPPTVIPSVGRFSVIADPQSATLSVFQPDDAMEPHDASKHGEFIWNELQTSDPQAALAFYGELFGWTLADELDMGPAGKYWIYGQGDVQYGGMMKADGDGPPAWIYYVNVHGLDAALERATAKGATTLHGPVEVPGGTRMAQLTDPQGALFALHGA